MVSTMSGAPADLVQACRACVEAYAGDDDRLAIEQTAAMLRHPLPSVIRWLTGALVVMTQELSEADLEGLTSRRLTDPTVVSRTVAAVRARDEEALLALADRDQVDVAILCVAVLACLI
jgi:hypothetical protein